MGCTWKFKYVEIEVVGGDLTINTCYFCENKAVASCSECGRFTCKEHGNILNGTWQCKEDLQKEKEKPLGNTSETYFRSALSSYKSGLNEYDSIMGELSTILILNSMLAVLIGVIISLTSEIGFKFYQVRLFQWSVDPEFILFCLFVVGIGFAIVSIPFCFIAWKKLGEFDEIGIEILTKIKDEKVSKEKVSSEYHRYAASNREIRDSINPYIRVGRSLSFLSLSILLVTILLIISF